MLKRRRTAEIEETPEINAGSNIDFLLDQEYDIEIEKIELCHPST